MLHESVLRGFLKSRPEGVPDSGEKGLEPAATFECVVGGKTDVAEAADIGKRLKTPKTHRHRVSDPKG